MWQRIWTLHGQPVPVRGRYFNERDNPDFPNWAYRIYTYHPKYFSLLCFFGFHKSRIICTWGFGARPNDRLSNDKTIHYSCGRCGMGWCEREYVTKLVPDPLPKNAD